MSRRTVLSDMRPVCTLRSLLLAATLATLVSGFPAPLEDDDSSGPLPFLQFTKGGIRVNFGGYHAQAGLGGLLTGRKADGGLHASAGTPSGAHASAGLGGSLDDGPAGGLHARAGLGNGGPEAEAGLGGTLAGPQPRGELYAGSSPGAGFVGSDKNNWIERTDGLPGKNIQIIARPKKASEQEAVASADASANANSGVPAASSKETSSSPSSSTASSGATANAGTTDGSGNAAGDKRSQLPARFYFQKRARERAGGYGPPALGESSSTSSHNAIAASASAGASTSEDSTSPGTPSSQGSGATTQARPRPPGIFVRATSTDNSHQSGASATSDVGAGKRRHKGSLFDDIFNIPISALNAVNQLLRNHVGKK